MADLFQLPTLDLILILTQLSWRFVFNSIKFKRSLCNIQKQMSKRRRDTIIDLKLINSLNG